MTNLRQAAQAVVDRWDSPAWEWSQQGPTADLMADLRKALAQPRKQTLPMKAADEFELRRLLAEERYTVRQLSRALREQVESPTFMGEPLITPPASQPEQEPCIGKDPRCPCQDGDACHYKDCGNTKAWPVPQAEPTPWRDMVVVTLVREGIDKHRARELADHFAAQPEQEPDRRPLQAAGTHPAPCARHCEAKAFEIEIRSLNSRLKQAQPEQEPLGWLDGNDKLAQFMHRDLKADHDKRGSATPREYTIPVYAAPPQRPWLSLTGAEIDANEILRYHFSLNNGPVTRAGMAVVDAVTAMLKERNNG